MLYVVITIILFTLSFVAGMKGLGVVPIATPVLGLFDLSSPTAAWAAGCAPSPVGGASIALITSATCRSWCSR